MSFLHPIKFTEIPLFTQQLMKIAERQNDPNSALRIAVESGGCHGYQYKMSLDASTNRSSDD